MPLEKNIFAACDDNFVEHFCVLAASIFTNVSDAKIWLLGVDISDASKEMISKTGASFSRVITVLDISLDMIDGLKATDHITSAAWARFLAPDLLPESVQRAIYLDCDMIVVDDLPELFLLNMKDHALAAVVDDFGPVILANRREKLGMRPNAVYFNSGIILIDMKSWRDNKIGQLAIDFGRENPADLIYPDQCALNAVIDGDYLPLSDAYNSMVHVSHFPSSKPKILHFASPDKPWLTSAESGGELYRLFHKLTPYPPLTELSLRKILRRWSKYFARWFLTYVRRMVNARDKYGRGPGRIMRFRNTRYIRDITKLQAEKIALLR